MDRKNNIACPVGSFSQKQVTALQVGEVESKMIKRALLCMSGTHQGMYGPVMVSPEMLQVIAERFNREYENPKNENDYPPVIKDHCAGVDNVLGRMLPPLVAEEFVNPRNGETVTGLFGDLRIDDPEAQVNVLNGKYAHVSISFDDDAENMGEIFETSFVAVEAARGSMVLKQGENNMDPKEIQNKLTAAEGSLAKLQKTHKGQKLAIKAAVKSLKLNLESASTAATEMQKELVGQIKSLKTTVIKAQFGDYVRQGKLSKAEMDKVDFDTVASMESGAQKVLLAAYANRPISADAFQHGTAGAQPLKQDQLKNLSSAEIRKLAKAQKEGKKVKLMEGEEKDPAELENNPEGVDPEKEPAVTGLTMEDIEEAMTKLEGLGEYQTRIADVVEKLKGTLTSLEGEVEEKEEDE